MSTSFGLRVLFPLVVAVNAALTSRAETLVLWGADGERWNPQSRLPDFSYAGYHSGEAPLPDVPPGVSVKAFGATGDGVTDDTAAFLKALAAVSHGAIEVPAGRYRITNILEITRSGVVLRGAGPDKTILVLPTTLQEIKPHWDATTGGKRTSFYSWYGGFVWFKGELGQHPLANVNLPAPRGNTSLHLLTTNGLYPGQRIEIYQSDTADNSLAAHLYSGDPGDTHNLKGETTAALTCRIVRIEGERIYFDRPLRFDVKPQWKPCIRSFTPTVSESGVENLCFEFPDTPYKGHFNELGCNAVTFDQVSDCWARHLRIVNADSGIFPDGRFCTIQNIVFESIRQADGSHCTGHHGIYFYGDDNLFDGFDYRTRFIHDISVSMSAGNVIAGGRGVDLNFDHHRRAPYENLFVNIDAGAGSRLWDSSGGAALGKHCGARGTFWNIRASVPQHYPPPDFGSISINLVGVQTDQPSEKNLAGRWFEVIPPGQILPQDIHAAQLARRLKKQKG